MARAAMLPTISDELLVNYWLRNVATWAHVVDEIHIMLTSADAHAIRLPELPAKYKVTRHPLPGHGNAMDRMLESVDAEFLLWCEDDAWVRRPEAVEAVFARLEAGACDVAGSPRDVACAPLIRISHEKFGPMGPTPTGDVGASLWPCWLFTKAQLLRDHVTTMNACDWAAGEHVQGVNWTATERVSSDTFGAATWELREAGARIEVLPQFRAHGGDRRSWIKSNPPWFHAGSLSVRGRGLHRRDRPTWVANLRAGNDRTARSDLIKRGWWWRRVHDVMQDCPNYALEAELLTDALDALSMSAAEIAELDARFLPWINWKDQDPCHTFS